MQTISITEISPPELEILIENTINKVLAKYLSAADNNLQDKILTIQEAGSLIHLATPTIYGLVHSGSIPHSKKGRRLYFSEKELLDWIKSGRRKTRAEVEAEANEFVNKKPGFGKRQSLETSH